MRRLWPFVMIISVLLLAGCGEDTASTYNFKARQDNTFFSADEKIIIDYKTDNNGKMIDINIDRLLTIEEMMLYHPNIDFNYELDGFDGDIFMLPSARCTDISNDVLVPINLEVGNTRYKYDDTDCTYKTVDNYNEFRAGFADEYQLTDTILEDKNTTISIIVYDPDEVVSFIEIYEVPHTLEQLGVYTIRINFRRDGFQSPAANYYRDTSMYEQLYLKHQANDGAVNELLGISEELNLLDLENLTETIPLIAEFDLTYELEIQAIEELQQDVGLVFDTAEEENPDDQTTEEE